MNDKSKQFASLIDEVLVLAAQNLPDGDYDALLKGVTGDLLNLRSSRAVIKMAEVDEQVVNAPRGPMVGLDAALTAMAQPDPRCTLCDLEAPPHRWHGLSAKFEPHGMANVPSGQAMLLDGPSPTPKQVTHLRNEALEEAAVAMVKTGRTSGAAIIRAMKTTPKDTDGQNGSCAGCHICDTQTQAMKASE